MGGQADTLQERGALRAYQTSGMKNVASICSCVPSAGRDGAEVR